MKDKKKISNSGSDDKLKLLKKKKRNKKIRNIIGLLAAAGLFAWFMSVKLSLEVEPDKYDFAVAYDERKIDRSINAAGKIQMTDNQIVYSDVKQKIKKINFILGDYVNEGDVLCEFESKDLDESIQRYEKLLNDSAAQDRLEENNQTDTDEFRTQSYDLAVQRARIDYDEAKSAYESAVSKYDDYYSKYYQSEDETETEMYQGIYLQYEKQIDTLFEKMNSSRKAYDRAVEEKNDFDRSRQNAESVKQYRRSGVADLEKALSELKEEREKLIVRSPGSGVISECFVSEGGYSFMSEMPGADGKPVSSGSLFRIGSLGDYKVEVYISSADILDAHEGQKAEITTSLTGSRKISGKISKISEIFDVYGYKAEITLDNREDMKDLRPNVSAAAKIYMDDHGMVGAVPYDSVVKEADGSEYVYRVDRKGVNSTAQKVMVKTGLESDYFVEITESDLQKGDLVLGNASGYREGQKLKLK